MKKDVDTMVKETVIDLLRSHAEEQYFTTRMKRDLMKSKRGLLVNKIERKIGEKIAAIKAELISLKTTKVFPKGSKAHQRRLKRQEGALNEGGEKGRAQDVEEEEEDEDEEEDKYDENSFEEEKREDENEKKTAKKNRTNASILSKEKNLPENEREHAEQVSR
jgi:hypothetical protein